MFARASTDGSGVAPADAFTRWRLANAERLTADDLARGHDSGGYCAEHGRVLSYPEQKRGACSWCIADDPEREPRYPVSHASHLACQSI